MIDYFRGDERFAEGKLFLFGGSQGGMICLYTAGKRPGDIAGLVALYPALNLQDICRHAQEEAKAVGKTQAKTTAKSVGKTKGKAGGKS